MGLEPTTFSLATRRSTTELCPLIVNDYRYLFFKIQSLLKFLDYIQKCDNVWICKRNEIAEHWYKNYK